MSSPEGSSPQSLRTWSTTSSSSRPAPHGSRPATGRPPRERRSPSARSRGGNHVSPTRPLLRRLAGGTSRFPRKGSPSPRSRVGGRRVSIVAAELRGARKAYGSVTALDDVDLTVAPGEIVTLLGPNGAGKTTAIRLLLGLRRPDTGTARLFGLDPHRAEARRRCGTTPQETDLPETLRVREILELVRAHYPRPLPPSELLE